MAGDLERFLQQAAERLKQKMEQQAPQRPAAPPPPLRPNQSGSGQLAAGQSRPAQQRPVPIRQAERAASRMDPLYADDQVGRAEFSEAEVVQAEVVDIGNRRELGPNPLSSLDTRDKLAREIDLTDEKLAGRLHDVFDHEVLQLQKASHALTGGTQKGSEVSKRQLQVSPLVDMLRQPKTLRAAFVASEVFARKF